MKKTLTIDELIAELEDARSQSKYGGSTPVYLADSMDSIYGTLIIAEGSVNDDAEDFYDPALLLI